MADNRGRLTPEDAEHEIRGIEKLGSVIPSPHCSEQMERRNYNMDDIHLVLSKGKVLGPPKYDSVHRNWEYEVEGSVIEGDKAIVVVAILSHNELTCITIKPK
jgi:hypothetical protein